MPSPFPGMDPWLERTEVFPGLHNGLVIYLQAALNTVLPPGYVATNDTRVYVDPELHRVPDVGVVGADAPPAAAGGTALAMTSAGLLAAATEWVADPAEETYLEIRPVDDDRVVTAVEVVSPANKRAGSGGRVSYQQKQGEYRASGVNVVEIDPLRGGPHTTAVPLARLRAVAGEYDYHVSVVVAGSPREYFVAPVRLADRLPRVPVPLDPGVAPATVDLQAAFDRCFDAGGYDRLVKYGRRRPAPHPGAAGVGRECLEGEGVPPVTAGVGHVRVRVRDERDRGAVLAAGGRRPGDRPDGVPLADPGRPSRRPPPSPRPDRGRRAGRR